MREIPAGAITETIASLFAEANVDLGEDVAAMLEICAKSEQSDAGRKVISEILENAAIAREDLVPICQDTGLAVVFAEIGQDVHVTGGGLREAVDEGVRRGWREGFLRASVVSPPFGERRNTGDNTPAVLHVSIVPGDRLRLAVAAKGGGSENMSAVRMLRPADGREGIGRFVVETIARAGANPCPPLVVGVGIGGTFELCALLAKRALLRRLGAPAPDAQTAGLEAELLREINRLGTGPAGYGGTVTALAVHVEAAPCHIASLPVAVNVNCHAHRHREATL